MVVAGGDAGGVTAGGVAAGEAEAETVSRLAPPQPTAIAAATKEAHSGIRERLSLRSEISLIVRVIKIIF